MRIRTLAGPPFPHEIVADTYRAILLTHSMNTAAMGDRDESTATMEEGW